MNYSRIALAQFSSLMHKYIVLSKSFCILLTTLILTIHASAQSYKTVQAVDKNQFTPQMVNSNASGYVPRMVNSNASGYVSKMVNSNASGYVPRMVNSNASGYVPQMVNSNASGYVPQMVNSNASGYVPQMANSNASGSNSSSAFGGTSNGSSNNSGGKNSEPSNPSTNSNDQDACSNSGSTGGGGGSSQGDTGQSSTTQGTQSTAGDPVIISTGEFIDTFKDMTVLVDGQVFIIDRRYGNQNDINLSFGQKWDSSLFARVEDYPTNAMVYTTNRLPYQFEKDGELYTGPTGQSLEKNISGYILTHPNGLKYYFDTNGQALSKVLRTGQVFKWQYDASDRVTGIADDSNNSILQFYYDGTLLTKALDVRSSRDVVYEYDNTSGDLTHVTGSCGTCSPTPEMGFAYDTDHNMTNVLNAQSQTILINEYDGQNRVTRQARHASSPYATYDYSDYSNNHYTYVGFNNVTEDHYLDNKQNLTKIQTSRNGNSSAWSYEYNTDNAITRSTSPEGRIIDTPTDPNNGRRLHHIYYDSTNPITYLSYFYGSYGNATRITDAMGIHTDYVYDTNGNLLTLIKDSANLNLTKSWDYDANGNKITHKDSNGLTTAYLYNSNTFLTKIITDPTGLSVTESYLVDAVGRITLKTDKRGKEWRFFYNSANKITKTTSPSGQTTIYDYDPNIRLVTLTQQDSETTPTITRTTTYQYDAYGNVTRKTEPGSRYSDMLYDDTDMITWKRTPTGEQYRFSYNIHNLPESQYVFNGSTWDTLFTFYYDNDKNLTKHTDANSNIVYARTFDNYNRLTRTEDALSNYVTYSYSPKGEITKTVSYDAASSILNENHLKYDSLGRLTSHRQLASPGSTTTSDPLTEIYYNSRNQKTRHVQHLTSSEYTVIDYSYDIAGRLLTKTQSDGPTIAFLYTDFGDLTKEIVDPTSYALATSYNYDEIGWSTRVTFSDSRYSVFIYDGLRRLTKTEQYDSSNSAYLKTEQIYDNHLNVITKTYQYKTPSSQNSFNSTTDPSTSLLYTSSGRLTATLDANSNVTTYDYDYLGRRITTTDPGNNKTAVVYDNTGRILTKIDMDYDGSNHITYITTYAYNTRNQITKTTDPGPDGNITTAGDNRTYINWYDALGRITQTQDTSGRKTSYHYNSHNQLTRQIEDSGTGGIGRITDRAYDRAHRLITLTGYTSGTTGSQQTVYAYNKAGIQTRITYPDDNPGTNRGYVVYLYDSMSRLTQINHQDNSNTNIVYDTMGQRLTVTKGTEVDSYTYTAWGDVASAKRGTTGIPDLISSVTRSYDGLMRLTREAQSVSQSSARNVDYDYDKSGNVLTLTYPNGIAIENSIDSLNRASIVKRDGHLLASYTYIGNRMGTQIFETGTNDVTLSMTYDGLARVTHMAYIQSGNTTLPDYSYAYDAASNITAKTFNHRSGTPTESYQYDTLYRLTHTNFGQRTSVPYEGFVYDDLGNHLTQDNDGTLTAGLYNAANEQTKRGTPGSETDVLYDQRGNLTKDDSNQVYFYDRQNMLTRVEDGSSNLIASYTYDALNRRIEKTVTGTPDVTTRFYYTASWQIIEETDDSASLQRYYVWAQGTNAYIDELLMMRDVVGTGGTANADYFACRHISFNITALIDSSGNIVERYDYNPYGKRFVLNTDYTLDADGISDIAFNFGHQGLQHDIESSLVYNRHRMYNPTLGKWMQRDILQYIDGMNTYNYLGSNPLMRIDPSGQFWHIVIGGVVGGIVGAVTGAITGGTDGAIKGAIAGAVGGAVTVATLNPAIGGAAAAGIGTGGSIFIGGTVSGAIGGAAGGTAGEIYDAATGETFDGGEIAQSTATGAIGGAITGGILGGAGGMSGGTLDDVTGALDDVTSCMMGVAEDTVGNTINTAIDESKK